MIMTITKDEASEALGEINAASGRARQMRGYNRAAPFLILWGAVWMVCDLTNQFEPRWWPAWPIGALGGMIASTVLGMSPAKDAPEHGEQTGGWRHCGDLAAGHRLHRFAVPGDPANEQPRNPFHLRPGARLHLRRGRHLGWLADDRPGGR